MKKLLLLVFFLLVYSCTGNKTVFWCGDHACINKKEKETYFKKTLTVEIKKISNKNKKNYSSHEKILQQVKTDSKKKVGNELSKELELEKKMRIRRDKKLAKQLKLEEEMRIKRERELAKQLKLKKKKEIKSQKKLAKKLKLAEKKKIKKEKKLTKQIKSEKDTKIYSAIFTELREKIVQKNLLKPYPDINGIQNQLCHIKK